jgi:hypothetical protein
MMPEAVTPLTPEEREQKLAGIRSAIELPWHWKNAKEAVAFLLAELERVTAQLRYAETTPASEVAPEVCALRENNEALGLKVNELEAQAAAMREALEHCKHRPHEHNPRFDPEGATSHVVMTTHFVVMVVKCAQIADGYSCHKCHGPQHIAAAIRAKAKDGT